MSDLTKEVKHHIARKFAGRVWCYTAITKALGVYGVGVAVADEPGYHPIEQSYWSDNRAEAERYADRLNAERHIPLTQAAMIVATTMVGEGTKHANTD